MTVTKIRRQPRFQVPAIVTAGCGTAGGKFQTTDECRFYFDTVKSLLRDF